MKWIITTIVAVCLVACGGASGNSSQDDNSVNGKDFIGSFYAMEQWIDYMETLDALIDQAEQEASADINNSVHPKAETNNGILVVVTLTHLPERSAYHVSFSRRPYFATSLARSFAGLIAARLGFTTPTSVAMSQNQVFHLEWSIENSETARRNVANVRKNLRAQSDPEKIYTDVFLNSIPMKIRNIEVQTN